MASKFERVDQESFREQNAAELERNEAKRLQDFVDSLQNQPLEMDMSKDTDESANLKDYKKNAHAGLRAILAKAAQDEAKAHGE